MAHGGGVSGEGQRPRRRLLADMPLTGPVWVDPATRGVRRKCEAGTRAATLGRELPAIPVPLGAGVRTAHAEETGTLPIQQRHAGSEAL
ncbi:MAG: hypothetical protein WDW38_000905 [Sanguina aurantia]